VESAIDQLERQDRPSPPALARALAGLTQSLTEVRRISHRLRPAMLDELGLPAALELLARETNDAGSTRVELHVAGEAVALPEEIKTALFRFTQEALANVAKHARAHEVQVALSFDEDGVALDIRDDGRGFELERVQLDPNRGVGLRNMRERLESISGSFEVRSAPGAGTALRARVPLEAIRRLCAG
jgi:two-component system, NarL family, sensor kinase